MVCRYNFKETNSHGGMHMNHSARRNRRRFAVVIAVMILVLAGVAIGCLLYTSGGVGHSRQFHELVVAGV